MKDNGDTVETLTKTKTKRNGSRLTGNDDGARKVAKTRQRRRSNVELGREVTGRTNKKEREDRVHVTPTTSIGYVAHPEQNRGRESWVHVTPTVSIGYTAHPRGPRTKNNDCRGRMSKQQDEVEG